MWLVTNVINSMVLEDSIIPIFSNKTHSTGHLLYSHCLNNCFMLMNFKTIISKYDFATILVNYTSIYLWPSKNPSYVS